MSFDNVTLPSFLIADLYKKNLVDNPDQAKKLQPEATLRSQSIATAIAQPLSALPQSSDKPLQFLGKNLKNFVIIVNYQYEVYMPENQLEFLGNILKACQLNLGDVSIVNYFTQAVNLERLSVLSPKHILVFGIGPVDPQLKISSQFQIIQQQDINIVNAPALELLNQNTADGKVLKGNLWNCLKQLLNI